MNQEEKNKLIKLQSEMLINYIRETTNLICEEEPPTTIITNQAQLDKIAEQKASELNEEEKDNLSSCNIAVKKLMINDIITKEVAMAYPNSDFYTKMDYITKYNKKIKYDENGVAINLAEVINEITKGGK